MSESGMLTTEHWAKCCIELSCVHTKPQSYINITFGNEHVCLQQSAKLLLTDQTKSVKCGQGATQSQARKY